MDKGISKFSLIIGIIILVLVSWIVWEFTKPIPGLATPDQGREHAMDIAGVEYASNPPTSGTHFPVWAKPGVYDRILSDGYLIHSLEHGYIVISYDCSQELTGFNLISQVYAHEDSETLEDGTVVEGLPLMHMTAELKEGESWFTPENPPDIEVELPETFNSDSCRQLADQLGSYTQKFQRIIVVPRPGMDTPIVLTAWRRIDKLSNIDNARIERFIRSYHDRGPEKTEE